MTGFKSLIMLALALLPCAYATVEPKIAEATTTFYNINPDSTNGCLCYAGPN